MGSLKKGGFSLAFLHGRWHWLIIGAFPIFLALTALFGRQGVWEARRLQERVRRLDMDVAEIQARNRELMAEIRLLRSGDGVYRRLARERLGLAMPGEIVYLFSSPKYHGALPAARESSNN